MTMKSFVFVETDNENFIIKGNMTSFATDKGAVNISSIKDSARIYLPPGPIKFQCQMKVEEFQMTHISREALLPLKGNFIKVDFQSLRRKLDI